MAYTKEIWKKRHRNRSDISLYITHLTKESGGLNAFQVLRKILTERKIIGSNQNGFVIGNDSAVCFQDIPLYGVCQNTFHEQVNRAELGGSLRYRPIGLTFEKEYIFRKGGRPVLYEQKNIAKRILPENEWWRIVNYDLSNQNSIIDWTHEREWRIKNDFKFDIKEAIIIMPHGSNYNELKEKFGEDILNQVKGISMLDPILT
ncbi:hypothetical protein [Maribacter polysaccharolyticus]|uniref:hypothetical protein n=1 Tax=Maribacter polysaccharolyticus TaxID=3020831 RepID=UPI00237FB710|nr:hypothetical protein [Maribacter polysaccharolyticus]MDE3744144.1 hypothetical protein [Maribacter polysaccharolyticus]